MISYRSNWIQQDSTRCIFLLSRCTIVLSKDISAALHAPCTPGKGNVLKYDR